MRWTWSLRQDERKRSRTAKSCRPDAPVAGVKFAMMLRITRMTVANKPGLAGESTKETVTPSRREGRIASAEPVCSCAFSTLLLHTRPRVQRAPGLPCALFFLGRMILQTSGEACSENAESYPRVGNQMRKNTFVVPANAGTHRDRHPEERPLGRVSKDGVRGHPSRRARRARSSG